MDRALQAVEQRLLLRLQDIPWMQTLDRATGATACLDAARNVLAKPEYFSDNFHWKTIEVGQGQPPWTQGKGAALGAGPRFAPVQVPSQVPGPGGCRLLTLPAPARPRRCPQGALNHAGADFVSNNNKDVRHTRSQLHMNCEFGTAVLGAARTRVLSGVFSNNVPAAFR